MYVDRKGAVIDYPPSGLRMTDIYRMGLIIMNCTQKGV